MRNILRKPLFLDGVKLCFSPNISIKSGCTCRISCGEHPLSPWTSSAANPYTSHHRCSASNSFHTDLRQLRIRVCLKMHDALQQLRCDPDLRKGTSSALSQRRSISLAKHNRGRDSLLSDLRQAEDPISKQRTATVCNAPLDPEPQETHVQ